MVTSIDLNDLKHERVGGPLVGTPPDNKPNTYLTTFSGGCLGSHNDEERSEMRYVMRIARPRESLKF